MLTDVTIPDATPSMSGGELALRLFATFRLFIDQLHDQLAASGHPGVRPAHGFALQAVGLRGATVGELGMRLGVSKQAAGKTVDALSALGYVERTGDPSDARRKIVSLTPAGQDVLGLSGAILQGLRERAGEAVGATRMRELEQALRTLTAGTASRLDAAGWLDAAPRA